MDAEGLEEAPYMVPDRVRAEVELGRDLFRRAALLEEAEHLDLPGGEMRRRRRDGAAGPPLEQAEDSDHALAAHERYRADLDGHSRAGGGDEDAARVRRGGGAEHLPGEQLAGAQTVLGRDDRGEVAAADVPDETKADFESDVGAYVLSARRERRRGAPRVDDSTYNVGLDVAELIWEPLEQ
jgi:hypothetical protein